MRAFCEIFTSSLVAPSERQYGREMTAFLSVVLCAGCALCIALLPLSPTAAVLTGTTGGATLGTGSDSEWPIGRVARTQLAMGHGALFLACISLLRIGEVTTRALGSTALPPMWEARSFGLLFIGGSVGGCLGSIAGTRLYEKSGGESHPLMLAVFLLLTTGAALRVATPTGGAFRGARRGEGP